MPAPRPAPRTLDAVGAMLIRLVLVRAQTTKLFCKTRSDTQRENVFKWETCVVLTRRASTESQHPAAANMLNFEIILVGNIILLCTSGQIYGFASLVSFLFYTYFVFVISKKGNIFGFRLKPENLLNISFSYISILSLYKFYILHRNDLLCPHLKRKIWLEHWCTYHVF